MCRETHPEFQDIMFSNHLFFRFGATFSFEFMCKETHRGFQDIMFSYDLFFKFGTTFSSHLKHKLHSYNIDFHSCHAIPFTHFILVAFSLVEFPLWLHKYT
jgi:hypothetical protein